MFARRALTVLYKRVNSLTGKIFTIGAIFLKNNTPLSKHYLMSYCSINMVSQQAITDILLTSGSIKTLLP